MPLKPSTELRVAPHLRIEVKSATEFDLNLGPTRYSGGAHTLALLEVFRFPVRVDEAMAALRGRLSGVQDWMHASSALVEMHRIGLLLDAEDAASRQGLNADGGGFDAAAVHIGMLNDRVRTETYLSAIRQSVRPGDVVVDLGTGTGVLAIAAAKAGAARVYAIESSAICATAQQMFVANGVEDRVTLIEGHSTQVQLPESADLLVAEIIGNDPLGEQILESTADAVRRFLKPDARIIPRRIEVWAAPIRISAEERRAWMFDVELAAQWKSAYGMDFSALASQSERGHMRVYANPRQASKWSMLAQPQRALLSDLRLTMHEKRPLLVDFEIAQAGQVDGVVFWFNVNLADNQDLTTDPRSFRTDNHWTHPLWLFGRPLTVQSGQVLHCRMPSSGRMEELELALDQA